MSYGESLDEALRSTAIEPEQGQNQPLSATIASETIRAPSSTMPAPTSEFTATPYRASSLITVHRRPYIQQDFSDSSSDSDLDDNFDSLPSPSSAHAVVIGNYVNVGHQNWLALRQEWKKRPVDWAPKRRLTLDSQTICDRITTSGVLSERSDEGVPLPDVVRVMVQIWEREGVN